MKHIKLFESFNSNRLPNFRVEVIKPGMSSGRWLFTCLDASWNSFFGVFDLDGLKKLEDAMNTECVFAELLYAIDNTESEENQAFEAHTTIDVGKVSPEDKFINLHYRNLNIPIFPTDSISRVSNPPPGLTVGGDGLKDEQIIHGFSVTTSKVPLKGKSEGVPVQNYPLVLNELHFADHHWSNPQKTKNYEKAFDYLIGFRTAPTEDEIYGMEEIQPYMGSIIDSGIPKGVLRTIEEIKKIESTPRSDSDSRTGEKNPNVVEFEKSSGFLDIIDELRNTSPDSSFTFDGDPGSQEREDSINRYKAEKKRLMTPLIQKALKLLQEGSSKLPPNYVEGYKMWLESIQK